MSWSLCAAYLHCRDQPSNLCQVCFYFRFCFRFLKHAKLRTGRCKTVAYVSLPWLLKNWLSRANTLKKCCRAHQRDDWKYELETMVDKEVPHKMRCFKTEYWLDGRLNMTESCGCWSLLLHQIYVVFSQSSNVPRTDESEITLCEPNSIFTLLG